MQAAALHTFIVEYGRKAQRGVEPNDRRADETVKRAVERMDPVLLDRLVRDDEGE